VLATRPVQSPPPEFGTTPLVSPNGRWTVFETHGPGSGQSNLILFDLQGRRPKLQLSYCRDPAFVLDGNTLSYWAHDVAGRNGLYVLPLDGGKARRVYPATEALEHSGEFYTRGNAGQRVERVHRRSVHHPQPGEQAGIPLRHPPPRRSDPHPGSRFGRGAVLAGLPSNGRHAR